MIIDPYAPVRRMHSEPHPTPDLPPALGEAETSHAPAVLRNSALQITGHVVAIGLTAASTIVLTRFLGVDDYGRFTVLTVFLLIGTSLSEFGLNGTAIRWFASGERPGEVFASLIGLRLVVSTTAALAAIAIFLLYPNADAPLAAVLLTAGAMILAGVNLTIPTALQARLDFRLAVVLDLTARAISFATFAVAALIVTSSDPDRKLVAAVAGLPAGYLVAVVVGLVAVRRLSFPIMPTFHPATWKRLLRDALPLGVVMILGLASYRLDALVLALLKDSHAVGIYGLAYRFMEAAIPLGAFITFAIFPLLVRDEPDHERRALQVARAADLLLVVAVAVAVSTIVLAPDLVRALGGPAYAASVVPLRILVLSLPFTFVAMILSWTLIARGLQHRLIPIVAGGLIVNLALNLALVPTYSYKASAGVTLTTEALGALTLVFFVRRWLHVGPAAGSVARIAVAGGAALGAGLLASMVTGEIIGTIVTVAAFAGLVAVLGLVTRAELDALLRRG
jgi:O-antigen/teichoic acid export membrane protein